MSTINPDTAYDPTYAAIARERAAQDAKWGEQNHPDGTGPDVTLDWLTPAPMRVLADRARQACQLAAAQGRVTWRHILLEEVFEALAEEDPDELHGELVQGSAVYVAWAQAIERRPVR